MVIAEDRAALGSALSEYCAGEITTGELERRTDKFCKSRDEGVRDTVDALYWIFEWGPIPADSVNRDLWNWLHRRIFFLKTELEPVFDPANLNDPWSMAIEPFANAGQILHFRRKIRDFSKKPYSYEMRTKNRKWSWSPGKSQVCIWMILLMVLSPAAIRPAAFLSGLLIYLLWEAAVEIWAETSHRRNK